MKCGVYRLKDKIEVQKKIVALKKQLDTLEVSSKEYQDINTQIEALIWVLKSYGDIDIAQYTKKNSFVEFG